MNVPTAPEVSVVVPAYNHEAYVGAALESVRSQSLLPGEIVVVDDGSTDGTASVVERAAGKWEDLGAGRGAMPSLRLLRQENRGAHAALNRGIEEARGPWIAILNSDDLLRPGRIEEALGMALASRAALLIGRVQPIDAEGRPLPPEHPTAQWYREALDAWGRAGSPARGAREQNAAVTTSNFFFLKEMWRRVGGFRAYRYVHDYDFLLRALSLSPDRVAFEPDLVTVDYRVHGANTISEDVERALEERGSMLRTHSRAAGWWNALRRVSATPALDRAIGRGRLDRVRIDPGGLPARGAGTDRRRCGIIVRDLDEGGLEGVVATLALGLPEHGLDPVVLCTHGGGRTAEALREAGVRVAVGRGKRPVWRRWLASVRPEVLSTHFAPVAFHQEAARLHVPSVDTIHNVYAWFGEGDWSTEREKAGLVSSTVFVSRTAAEYHARHVSRVPLPATVIPNGVRPSGACLVPRAWARRLLGVDPDAFLFVHVGRIDRQKNPTGLLAAFRAVRAERPRARLILAGAGVDAALGEEIRGSYGDLLASGDARILHLPQGVGPLLSAADAYVSLSLFEGWSLAASEAIWCGLPVVLSDTGGSRELAGGEGERGWVVANPVGDPLGASPSTLSRPDPEAAERAHREMVVRMSELAERPFPDGRRAAIRAWGREHLDASRSVAAHAATLRTVLAAPVRPAEGGR